MSLIKNYFDQNNIDQKKKDRNIMARRELLTISYLLKEYFNFELSEGMNILDLGSGDKFLKKEIEDKGLKYNDLDIDDVNFESEKFNYEDNKFDLVISLAVIEHIKDPSLFLNECKRVVKKNSIIFLSTPNWKYTKNTFWDDYTHVKPYSPESLKNILTSKGFNDVEIFPNLRCKSRWWYEGKFKFFKAYYLLPFTGNAKFVPDFLKGKSKGLFAIAKK